MKSNFKSKILVVLILILVISISFAFYQQTPNSEVYNNPLKEENPKLNAPDITIITPENKTYTEPMSGYYPATYGFECDKNKTLPKDWNFYNKPNCNITILDELDGHKKVIKGEDQNSVDNNWFWIYNNISQTSGTVEFYVRTTDNTEYVAMRFYEVDYWDGLLLDIYNSQFRYYDGSTHNIMAINNNQWYHIRIDFETGSGGYEGLAADMWHLWIDGEKKSSGSGWNFRAPTTQMNFFQFDSAYSDTSGFQAYFDAIGYSWDPNYNIGDNLNEGLLLSFENSTSLDWMGYSFDGQTNNTILGNSTFPMPEDGLHTIQVFGNDSIGQIHESDTRYFSVKFIPINLITPENITYTGPMSGYYPATYGFENDRIGSIPKEWNHNNKPSCTTSVIAELDGHKKVIKGEDQNSIPDNWFWIYNNLLQTSGTVEFYVRTTDNTEYVAMRLYEVDYWDGLLLDIYNSQFRYYNGSTHNVTTINNNQWYHIRIDFETGSGGYEGLAADMWHLWIDGEKKSSGSGWNFRAPTTQMNFFQFDSAYSDTSGFQAYFDAIGYSWDPKYNIGDNLEEGLLLSFDTAFNPDWIGYSLNGQNNRTILGNTTIPIPEDGLHTIQVFGNNSLGTMYQSDVRYFEIDMIPSKPSKPIIHGYNLWILIGIISIASIIIISKKIKK